MAEKNGREPAQLIPAHFILARFVSIRETISAFRDAGVLPEMVQIGNEISAGMLWPDGKLPDHWQNFADLLKAGIKGVQTGCATNPRPRIMIHTARGGDKRARSTFSTS